MTRKNISKSARIDLSGMPCGVYVFKIISGNSTLIKKILKQ
ncbi:MAG: T9SS type A sorting domain-containing protein [Bacteroidota bacterium]